MTIQFLQSSAHTSLTLSGTRDPKPRSLRLCFTDCRPHKRIRCWGITIRTLSHEGSKAPRKDPIVLIQFERMATLGWDLLHKQGAECLRVYMPDTYTSLYKFSKRYTHIHIACMRVYLLFHTHTQKCTYIQKHIQNIYIYTYTHIHIYI